MELKSKIAEAAEIVIRTHGLAKATTKEIARTAGCSEGSLYNHFKSKDDLYLHILRGQLKNFMQTLISLKDLIGKDTVRSNLEKVARAGLADYYQSMPLIGSIFSEPGLLAQHRKASPLGMKAPTGQMKPLNPICSRNSESGEYRNLLNRDPLRTCCWEAAINMLFN